MWELRELTFAIQKLTDAVVSEGGKLRECIMASAESEEKEPEEEAENEQR